MRLSGGHGGTIPSRPQRLRHGAPTNQWTTLVTTLSWFMTMINFQATSESLQSFDKKKGHCGCSCANITTLVAMRLKCWYLEVQRWQSRGYKLVLTFLWQSEKIFSTLRKRGRCTDFFYEDGTTNNIMHDAYLNSEYSNWGPGMKKIFFGSCKQNPPTLLSQITLFSQFSELALCQEVDLIQHGHNTASPFLQIWTRGSSMFCLLNDIPGFDLESTTSSYFPLNHWHSSVLYSQVQ